MRSDFSKGHISTFTEISVFGGILMVWLKGIHYGSNYNTNRLISYKKSDAIRDISYKTP